MSTGHAREKEDRTPQPFLFCDNRIKLTLEAVEFFWATKKCYVVQGLYKYRSSSTTELVLRITHVKNRSPDQEVLELHGIKGVPIFPVRKGQAGSNTECETSAAVSWLTGSCFMFNCFDVVSKRLLISVGYRCIRAADCICWR